MARVPIENLPGVAPAGMPDVRVSPNAPEAAFGGGQDAAQSFGQARGLANDIMKEQDEIRQRADLAAVFKATAELSDYATDVQYNPQTGIVAQKGENAFPLAKTVPEGWRKKVSGLMGSLSSPEQRQTFQRQADQHWGQLNGFNQRHIAGQSEQFMAQQADAYVASRQNAGALAGSAGNLQGIEDAARDVDQARRVWALKNGVSRDAADVIIASDTSKVYAGAIGAMLDAGNDLAAKDAFAKYRGMMTADDIKHIGPMVQRESSLGEAYRLSDVVLSYEPETLQGALTHLDKIIEGDKLPSEVRAKAGQIIHQRYAVMQDAKEQAHKADMGEAKNILDGGKTYDDLPATLRSRLNATAEKDLRRYAAKDAITDNADWYSLMLMSASNPSQFANENLLSHKLSASDLQEMGKLQASVRKGDMTEADGFRSVDGIVSGTIHDKVKGDDKEKFMREINRQVRAWKSEPKNKGNKIPNEVVEQMTDTLLKDVIQGTHLWFWDDREPLYKMAAPADVTKAAEERTKTLRSIPEEDISKITNDLRAKGIVLTEQNILRFYAELQSDREKAKNARK